jgi:SAM-dependent methyltransferase
MLKTYEKLYNEHPDYVAVRDKTGDVWSKYKDDVLLYKIKHAHELVHDILYSSILEVGCATGFLLHNFPGHKTTWRCGIDISTENIISARREYPGISFFAGTLADFLRQQPRARFDLVLLSDILEHVEDDVGLLNACGSIGKFVLLNLPLEKVDEYRDRNYGMEDRQGHLRAYSKADASKMFVKANLSVVRVLEAQYVCEPVFRKYLFNKLVKDATGDKLKGLIQYTEELIHIDNHPGYYKSNLFALLSRARSAKKPPSKTGKTAGGLWLEELNVGGRIHRGFVIE